MSGCGYTSPCPKCGATMSCYSDWKPYDMSSAECLECGFEYHTEAGQLTLEEVNAQRLDQELPPLEKLAAQVLDQQMPEKPCNDGSIAIQT